MEKKWSKSSLYPFSGALERGWCRSRDNAKVE